jgi:hypothetical protein
VAVLVRLVGRRAHHVPQGAVPAGDAAPLVHRALLSRRLIIWSHQDLIGLLAAAPHPDLPQPLRLAEVSDLAQPHLPIPEHTRAVVVEQLATRWRGQLDPPHPRAAPQPCARHPRTAAADAAPHRRQRRPASPDGGAATAAKER